MSDFEIYLSYLTATFGEGANAVSFLPQSLTDAQKAQALLNLDGASIQTLAPAFSATAAYAVGDYVVYDGKLYRFAEQHAAGEWDASEVAEVTVGGELNNKQNTLIFDNTPTAGSTNPVTSNGINSALVTVIDNYYHLAVLKASSKADVDALFAEWWSLVYRDGADKAMLVDRWFERVMYDDRVHGAKLPLYETSTSSDGVLTDDSVELSCTPSTASTANTDDFAKLPQFWILEVAAEKNSDGTVTIYKVQHVDPVAEVRGGDHLCQVLQKNCYYKEWQADGYHYHRQQCTAFDGAELYSPANAQGETYHFTANPKYLGGLKNGVLTCGTGLAPILKKTHTENIAAWKAKNPMYCGGNYRTYKFLMAMMALKYARKGNSGVIDGCSTYNLEYTAAVSETNVERVILTTEQAADLLAGSSVCIGDRSDKCIRITSVEEVTISETTYAAVNLDNGGTKFNTTAGTTYLRTMPYFSGWNDGVKGNDGSKISATSGKEPGLLQGIEFMLGAYVIVGDELMNWVSSRYLDMYVCNDPSKAASSITSDYTKISRLDCESLSTGWYYIKDMAVCPTNFPLSIGSTAGDATGVRAALRVDRSSGVRASWVGGALTAEGPAGLPCRSSNGATSISYWHGASGSPSVTQ